MFAEHCGAKTRAGGTCRQPAMENGRCRLHGGMTPRGLASPNFKHGRYSNALPDRLIERYARAASDPNLIVLREDIALVDALMNDILLRLDTGESGRLWRSLREAADRFEAKRRAHDLAGVQVSLDEIISLVRQGDADWASRREVLDHLAERRKLAAEERKRLAELQASITAERAMALIAAVVSIVKGHVHDQAVLASIAADIGGLVGRPGVEPPGGAGDRA